MNFSIKLRHLQLHNNKSKIFLLDNISNLCNKCKLSKMIQLLYLKRVMACFKKWCLRKLPNKKPLKLERMLKLLNLLFNSNNKQQLLPFNRQRKLNWQFNRQRKPELHRRNKIKSIEKMLSLLPCKKLKKRPLLLLKSPGKRLLKKRNFKDNGMLLWHKELSRKRKIRKLLNLPLKIELPKIKLIENKLRLRKRPSKKHKEPLQSN